MPEVVRLLLEWGVEVELIYPEEQMIDVERVEVKHDLYVLKSGTELALSLAGALHAVGAKILNPYPVAEMLRDKIVSSRILQAAKVPYPETYITGRPSQLALLLNNGPLVVKPYRGSQGQGVRVVWDADELDNIQANQGPIFAQRYYQPQGLDHKIYCIGGQIFGVKRVWPARTYEEKLGQSFTITPEVREITLRCGQAFGIDLFGVDIIMNEGRPIVVDMSSFPGFKGVPEAALRLADYIYTAGQRVLRGEPLLSPVQEEVMT
jgi:ribosomal protein S6--L-glutamate ligase